MAQVLALLLPVVLLLQDPASRPATQPAARSADVATPEALVAALYDVISGPAGQKRDADRFRSLFLPGARMVVVQSRPDGSVAVAPLAVDEHVRRSFPVLEQRGFWERGAETRFAKTAHTAQAWSRYEIRFGSADAEVSVRGVNAFHLVSDGARWWIAALQWEAEGR